MSLADVLQALAETGATPAQLVAAVRAEEAAQARAQAEVVERRRARSAERQRRKRLRDAAKAQPELPLTDDVTRGHAESRGVTQGARDSSFLPLSPSPRPLSTNPNQPSPPKSPPAEGDPAEVDGGEGAAPGDGEATAAADQAAEAALFEAAWRAYPHAKGRSSRPKALAAWLTLDPATRTALPGAVARYRAEGREPRRECGAKAFELWLADGRFLDWLGDGGGPAASAPGGAWSGPADLRAEVAAAAGEDFARAYLDPSGWRPAEGEAGEILARTGTAAERLTRELRTLLKRRGVTVGRAPDPVPPLRSGGGGPRSGGGGQGRAPAPLSQHQSQTGREPVAR